MYFAFPFKAGILKLSRKSQRSNQTKSNIKFEKSCFRKYQSFPQERISNIPYWKICLFLSKA